MLLCTRVRSISARVPPPADALAHGPLSLRVGVLSSTTSSCVSDSTAQGPSSAEIAMAMASNNAWRFESPQQ
jgi:hypothetical protein